MTGFRSLLEELSVLVAKTFSLGDDSAHVLARIAAILGAQNAGKTALLRIIAGLDRADAGDVLLDDASILAAQRALWEAARIAAEPAASVGIAALLTGAYKVTPAERVAVVISGANMAPAQLGRNGD